MSSATQPNGPAIFMSEFGATTSPALAGFDTEWAGLDEVGWAYWAWKYYDDPTGSSAEGLVLPNGAYTPIVSELSRTYPQEVAGHRDLHPLQPLHRRVRHDLHARPFGLGPYEHLRRGPAALSEWLVRGGPGRHITSPAGSSHLTISTKGRPLQIYVTVTGGVCP